MLGIKQIAALLGFVLLLSGGQLLFKKAAISVPVVDRFSALIPLAKNVWLWSALLLYGVAVVLWIVILQKIPLSTAYPFTALCFIVVPFAATLFFQEPYSLKTLAAAVLILGGIRVDLAVGERWTHEIYI